MNNTKWLTIDDLNKPIGELFHEVMIRDGRDGIPTFYYEADKNLYKVILQDTNWGMSVSVCVSHIHAGHLPRFYPKRTLMKNIIYQSTREITQ